MKYSKYIDERGIFQELFRFSEDFFDVEQVSFCKVSPQKTRGGHYHKAFSECFIVIEGEMELRLRAVNCGSFVKNPDCVREKILMTSTKNQRVFISPYFWHEVYSEVGCKFLILSNKEFDPEDPDTYRIGK